MRRINLLPSDERGRTAERFGGGVLGILLIAGALVVVVKDGLTVVTTTDRATDLKSLLEHLRPDLRDPS